MSDASLAADVTTAAFAPNRTSKRVLEPAERVAEVLFGLIMVLTFTGSLSVAEAGTDDVKAMLIGALGCNLAWAVIDALFYLMGCLAEKGRNIEAYHAVVDAKTPEQARLMIASALPPLVASLLTQEDFDKLHERALALPAQPKVARLDRGHWLGGWGVFLLVFLSTFPVAIPFMVIESLATAMRVSNAVALAMLFIAGFMYGRVIHRSPIAIGIASTFIGIVIVTFTIALGG